MFHSKGSQRRSREWEGEERPGNGVRRSSGVVHRNGSLKSSEKQGRRRALKKQTQAKISADQMEEQQLEEFALAKQRRLLADMNRFRCRPRRRNLPPGTKRPRSQEVLEWRRRQYARYAIRCEMQGKRPKYVPEWWRNTEERDHMRAIAFMK